MGREDDGRAQVRRDFDAIATHSEEQRWDHNRHYHSWILDHLPARCDHALEIGCGKGELTAKIATRGATIEGLDLSPAMIERARQLHSGVPGLRFEISDVCERELEPDSLDAIVSVATFHHLPLAELLPKLASALRPGGRLLVVDLYEQRRRDHLLDLLAMPLSVWNRRAQWGQAKAPELVKLWEEHGARDEYLRIEQGRDLYAKLLPGAKLRQRLFWRYTMLWEKPQPSP